MMQYSFDFGDEVLVESVDAREARRWALHQKHKYEWPPELSEEDERIMDAVWDRMRE